MFMDDDLKLFAYGLVQKICRKIRCEMKKDFFQMSRVVDVGADGTPTMYIDRIAEDVAITAVKKSSIPINLLSEECGLVDNGGKWMFVLDPVDGTRNAYRGIPFFSVSLAIGTETLDDVKYGIVKNVLTGDEFIAERHKGAFLNNKQIAVSEVPPPEMLTSIMLGRYSTPYSAILAGKHNIRSLGAASLEMCLVAMGALDIYYVGREFMRVIDIAAATLIVHEAGGVVTNRTGDELRMGLNLEDRTSIIAAGSREVISVVVACDAEQDKR
jgi:fructose-1,6-bisphosphatase/inositol monophosphatase family enzyme